MDVPASIGLLAALGRRSGEGLDARLAGLPARLFVACMSCIATLGVLHALFTWTRPGTFDPVVARLFDLDREMNLPTWFASSLWLLLAATLVLLALEARLLRRGRVEWGGWLALALAAVYFSADEVAVLHERLGTLFEEWLRIHAADATWARSLLGFPSYYWILVYAPLALPAGLIAVRFVWRRASPRARGAVALGMFVFVYAAVGLDFLEGRFGEPDRNVMLVQLGDRLVDLDIYLLEELLEMTGVALAVYGFATCLTDRLRRNLTLDDTAGDEIET